MTPAQLDLFGPRPIDVGSVVVTSYGTGPYRVVSITRGCTCPSYADEINGRPRPSAPHIHMTCDRVERRRPREGHSYLNGYDEETLRSVWSEDRLFVVEGARP